MSTTIEIIIWIVSLILVFRFGVYLGNDYNHLKKHNKILQDSLRKSEVKLQSLINDKKETLLKDLPPDGYCIYHAFIYTTPSPNGSTHSTFELQWNKKLYLKESSAIEAKESLSKCHDRWINKIVPVYILNEKT